MSPLALFYVLLAGSPMFHSSEWNWNNVDNVEPSTWSSVFDFESTPSTFETRNNWFLRKAIRNTFSTRRSFLRELTGEESPLFSTVSPVFSTESLLRNVAVISRIAHVNPILIEKLLTRPESHRFIEKVLRHVEPETLLVVEKLIKKNIPSYIREKIARRVIKSLIRSTSVMPRRSIVSELYPVDTMFAPTTFDFDFESIFSSPLFVEEPINKILAKKLFRHSEVSEVVLSKIVKKLVKKSIRRCPFLASIQIEKVAELKSLFHELKVESHLTTPSVWTVRRIVKTIRDIVFPERIAMKKVMKKSLKLNKLSVFCNYCENVCESSTPYLKYSKICSTCTEVCHTSTFPIFSSSKVLNKERLVKKLIKKVAKLNKFSKKNKLCRVCKKVCEEEKFSTLFSSPVSVYSPVSKMTSKICRVCDEVCESSRLFPSSSIFGRRHHFSAPSYKTVEYKLLKKLVKNASFEPLF